MKELIESLNKAFNEFKDANDERIKALEKNGNVDPLIEEKVDKANSAVTAIEDKIKDAKKEMDERLDNFELDIKQNGLGGNGAPDQKELRDEARQFYNTVNGSKVDDAAVDVDAYSAYKQAFNCWLRDGNRAMNNADIRNALSVGSDPDGGQWVPASTSNRIITKIFETSPMRQIANVVTIGTDRLEIPKDLDEGTSGGVTFAISGCSD